MANLPASSILVPAAHPRALSPRLILAPNAPRHNHKRPHFVKDRRHLRASGTQPVLTGPQLLPCCSGLHLFVLAFPYLPFPVPAFLTTQKHKGSLRLARQLRRKIEGFRRKCFFVGNALCKKITHAQHALEQRHPENILCERSIWRGRTGTQGTSTRAHPDGSSRGSGRPHYNTIWQVSSGAA